MNHKAEPLAQAWQDSAAHRERIGELLNSLAGDGSSSLCVWGAGPCNDLDLEQLLQRYSHITLVDLEGETLRDAVRSRGLEDSNQLMVVGDCDLSGIVQLVEQYVETSDPEVLQEMQRVGQFYEPPGLAEYDVVVSTCLLSQIFKPLVNQLERSNPQMMFFLLPTLRQRHLELLVRHTKPGGKAILITDVTSSTALPELASPEANLSELLRTRIVQGNHFHALNPTAIQQAISRHLLAPQLITEFQVSEPWVWNATHRYYCVLAYQMHKS